MSPSLRRWLLLLVIAGGVLFVDQLTKRIVIDTMQLRESRQPIPALYPFFQITRSENTGAAFGILPEVGDIFLIIAVVIVTALIVFYPRLPENATVVRVAVALICGGALGNALDRLQYGLVVDFIHYQIPGLISNVSNVADHAIVGGVLIWFIDNWRKEGQTKTQPVFEGERQDDQPVN
jgi:signal peptidase II